MRMKKEYEYYQEIEEEKKKVNSLNIDKVNKNLFESYKIERFKKFIQGFNLIFNRFSDIIVNQICLNLQI